MKESAIRKIIREALDDTIPQKPPKVDWRGVEEFKGVKGNQRENSKITEEIFEKYPHIEAALLTVTSHHAIEYGIGDIWDAGNYIVFYFYQSGMITKKANRYMEKYNMQIQIAMGDGYTFNVSVRKK